MIPVKLSLRNFMCYRDNAEVLDLQGVHLACLSGENGAGKSALLEAITWALWGRARDHYYDDELISKGASEMEVDFTFAIGGQYYRVLRKRVRKGNSGNTTLDLQVCTGSDPLNDSWKVLSGGTKSETQDRINSILRIKYETFINSAFILQGRADEFTIKKPAERKQVLADILGLEQYDRLEERAKEEVRQRTLRLGELKMLIGQIDRELEKRPDFASRLREVEDILAARQSELSERRAELLAVQSHEQKLLHARDSLDAIKGRMAGRERQMDGLKTRIVRNDERRKSLEALVARRAEIEKGWTELQSLQQRDEHLNDVRGSLDALDKERIRLDGELSGEQNRLEFQVSRHEETVRRLTRNLEGRPALEKQLAEMTDRLSKLSALQAQHEDTRCTKEALEVKLRSLVTERGNLEREGKVIRSKLDLLVQAHAKAEGHVGCPLCGTDLSEDALRRVRESYEDDIEEKRREFREKDGQVEETKKELVAVDAQLAREQDELKPLEGYRKREAELRQKQLSLNEDEETLATERGDLDTVKKRLAGGDFGHEMRGKLATVQARIARLEYDPVEHTRVKRTLGQLRAEAYESQYQQLQLASRDLPGVQEAIDEENAALAELRVLQEADHEQELALAPVEAELEQVRAARVEKERDADQLNREVTRFLEERGELKNRLAHCDARQEEKTRHLAEQKTLTDELDIYQRLTEAFGKKGIQAMVIENVIPEIEEEANSILGRMTDGRMNVQFATQRDAKTGKSIIETLDINISDEMGTRAYELYSGGEAFRVNFALRIALSKLLARRAGTQLQTLVIDEGFGSQDGQGREKLVAAIRSIQDDFDRILVITHIEELKEEFPVRINIVKTGTGSRIAMDAE